MSQSHVGPPGLSTKVQTGSAAVHAEGSRRMIHRRTPGGTAWLPCLLPLTARSVPSMLDLATDLAAREVPGAGVGWGHAVVRMRVDVGSAVLQEVYESGQRLTS